MIGTTPSQRPPHLRPPAAAAPRAPRGLCTARSARAPLRAPRRPPARPAAGLPVARRRRRRMRPAAPARYGRHATAPAAAGRGGTCRPSLPAARAVRARSVRRGPGVIMMAEARVTSGPPAGGRSTCGRPPLAAAPRAPPGRVGLLAEPAAVRTCALPWPALITCPPSTESLALRVAAVLRAGTDSESVVDSESAAASPAVVAGGRHGLHSHGDLAQLDHQLDTQVARPAGIQVGQLGITR